MRALSAVQAAIRRVDAAAAMSGAASLNALVDRSIGQRRAVMQLLIVFAIVGALLGIIGVHGVVAFAVAQRTRELGIRAALGARPRAMLVMVAGHGARLSAIGIGLGTLGAVGATRGLKGLLYGVSPSDPLTYIALGCGLLVVMLLASYLPARRALRIDPVIALRME
jgi:ABC-type antimicrobial peptide transport system permease subunit